MVGKEENCPFPDVEDSTMIRTYVANIEVMLGFHILVVHRKPPTKKEEGQETILPSKKQKRMESKPPKFMEHETRNKFRRK